MGHGAILPVSLEFKLVQAGHTFITSMRERRRRAGAMVIRTVMVAEVDHCR